MNSPQNPASPFPTDPRRREVAIAILQAGDRYLLQLRDNIPGIVYPGYWGLFGGHLEAGESPEEAIARELVEEIGYSPAKLVKFGAFEAPTVVRHVYHGELDVPLDRLQLLEGWDMGLWSAPQIRQGDRYSEKAGETRPLGMPHQQILLAFIDRHP